MRTRPSCAGTDARSTNRLPPSASRSWATTSSTPRSALLPFDGQA